MLTTLTVILLIAMFIVWKTVIIVPMREMCIVERLGKFRAVLEPGFHFLIPFFDRVAYRHEAREQVPALVRLGGPRESRPVALGRIGGQGELGNQQQFAADITKTQIHPSLSVCENPKCEQTLQQPNSFPLRVAALHTHEHSEPSANAGNSLALHDDVRVAHSL